MWLSGLSAGLRTKRLLVRFPVKAHVWVAGQVPSRGCAMICLGIGENILPRETYWRPIVIAQAQNNDESHSFIFCGASCFASLRFSGGVY